MALIEWREEFRVGVPEVDHEHEELIRVINELYAVTRQSNERESVIDFLGEIYARISAHFALEEKVMQERHYDQYSEHKADHERLLDGIREIMDDFELGAYGRDYGSALTDHLRTWFTEHFRTHDARLHQYIGTAAL